MRTSRIFRFGLLILLFSVIPAKCEEGFTVTAFNFGGGLEMNYDWKVRITGTSLSIQKLGGAVKEREISDCELNEVRQSIFENEFSNLREYYGNRACNDCAVLSIEVTMNGRMHRVAIYETV